MKCASGNLAATFMCVRILACTHLEFSLANRAAVLHLNNFARQIHNLCFVAQF